MALHDAALASGRTDPSAPAGSKSPQSMTEARPAQMFRVAAREAARHGDVALKPVQRTGTELTYSFKTWNGGETARVQLTSMQAGQTLSMVASSPRAQLALTEGLPALHDAFAVASVELDRQEGEEARGRRRALQDEEEQA